MKKRKVAVILSILGFLLVVLGVSILIYKDFTNKKKNKEEIEENIVLEYNDFKEKVETFNEKRSIYYSDIASNLFTETVEGNYDDWNKFLDDYTKLVDDIEDNSNYLKDKCVNKYYSNKEVSNKCDSFVIAYETVINYYTKDIESFNEVLDEYRRENNESKESEIKDYVSKYNYVDINLDGEFIGKK